MYGDPENHDLRHAIARHHALDADNVMIGEGIDGLLGYVVRMFLEPGDSVVTSLGAYPTFNYHVVGYNGKLVTVPYRDDREDVEALLDAAVGSAAKLIYLANPDNPMGTCWTAGSIDSMICRVPAGSLLLLDEAYGEFAEPGTLPAIDCSSDRVLRFRTFSKAYGLAGIRVGYVLGNSKLIAEFNKVRNHFGVGRVAQAAGLAALKDQSYLTQVFDQVKAARARIVEIASDNGLSTVASATNFVAIDCGRDGEFAGTVLNNLVQRGIFVRMPGVVPLNRCIRVTAGLEHDLDALADALPAALADANYR
jgi:histidinol-phosphate aminotransferase